MFSAAARHKALLAIAEESKCQPFEQFGTILRGDVVVELDGGLGLVTRALLELGCKHVYVVESSELSTFLRSSFRDEGVSSRVTIVSQLEELIDVGNVDVVVTKAYLPRSFGATLLPDLPSVFGMPWFASARTVVPEVISVDAAPVSFAQADTVATPWSSQALGLDLSPLDEFAKSHLVAVPLGAADPAAASQTVAVISLATARFGILYVERTFRLSQSCELHGIGVRITTRQGDNASSSFFLPFPCAIYGAADENLSIRIGVPVGEGLWSAVPLDREEQDRSVESKTPVGPSSLNPHWHLRPHRARVLCALLREIDGGVPQERLVGRVCCALAVRDPAERRVIRQTIRSLLCEGLVESKQSN